MPFGSRNCPSSSRTTPGQVACSRMADYNSLSNQLMKDTLKRRLRLSSRIVGASFVTLLAIELLLRCAGCYYRKRFWDASALSGEDLAILAVGESTTGGLWLPPEDSYPKQLQRLLRDHCRNNRIQVLIPPHTGQNTSQMLHRFPRYLSASRPALVLVMAGVNNKWSLAESNLGDFMPRGDWRTYAFRLRRWTDDVKVFRLFRYLFDSSGQAWKNFKSDLEGKPRYTPWPPEDDPLVGNIGREAFVRLWRSDVGQLIEQARKAGAAVILMTYPNYDTPPLSEFQAMAQKWSLPLVDNHKAFADLIRQGRAKEFFFEDLRHPNAKGYSIVAQNAFRAVLKTGRLKGCSSEEGSSPQS